MLKIPIKRIDLPVFVHALECDKNDVQAVKRIVKHIDKQQRFEYFSKPFTDSFTGLKSQYNLLPVVLNKDGSPWSLASLYLLDRLGEDISPNIETFRNIATDLAEYRDWLENDENPDDLLFHFPKFKQARVTYRFAAHQRGRVMSLETTKKVANRQISRVMAFYAWLLEKQYFFPEYPFGEAKNFKIKYTNSKGLLINKNITSYSNLVKGADPRHNLDGYIIDGGKLKPLSHIEQGWLETAMSELGNIEMNLILLVMLLSGARIQTVCTLRIGDFLEAEPHSSVFGKLSERVVKIKAGAGTGTDTKGAKNGILMIPIQLYLALHAYAISPRVKERCSLHKEGWHSGQYLFITQQGSPYYEASADIQEFDPDLKKRHHKKGETIRQYLADRILPFIQQQFKTKFKFRLHDLRATYGMNMQAKLMKLVQAKKLSLDQARQILRTLMWHEYSETTDLYLDYEVRSEAALSAINSLGVQVESLVNSALKGFQK